MNHQDIVTLLSVAIEGTNDNLLRSIIKNKLLDLLKVIRENEKATLEHLCNLIREDGKGKVIICEDHQPLFVKNDAVNTFDKWNEVTGAIPEGTSWYYETQAVIEEITAMAFGAGIMYEAKRHDG